MLVCSRCRRHRPSHLRRRPPPATIVSFCGTTQASPGQEGPSAFLARAAQGTGKTGVRHVQRDTRGRKTRQVRSALIPTVISLILARQHTHDTAVGVHEYGGGGAADNGRLIGAAALFNV